MFETEITLILGGLVLGGVYALLALGLNLIFGVSGILNLAHGDFLMLGALTCFLLQLFFGINPFLMVIVLVPLFVFLGIGVFMGIIRPIMFRRAEEVLISSIIVTVGLSLMIEDATAYALGYQLGINYFTSKYTIPPIVLGGVPIPVSSTRLVSLIIMIMIALVLHKWIKASLTGKMIRAIMQDREAAIMLGMNATKVTAITFGIGIFLAAIGGLFYFLITNVTAFHGLPLTIKAFTVLVLGGLGSFLGVMIGAIIIGMVEVSTSYYLGSVWATPVAIIVLIIVLIVRPQGLFGRRE